MDIPEQIPAPFASPEFPWKDMLDGDYWCKADEYFLRVEQTDDDAWWWRVYYNEHTLLHAGEETTDSIDKAIGLCEGVCLAHRMYAIKL